VDLESVSTTGNVHPHYAAELGGDHNSPRNLALRRSHAVRIRQEWLRGGGEPSRILISQVLHVDLVCLGDKGGGQFRSLVSSVLTRDRFKQHYQAGIPLR